MPWLVLTYGCSQKSLVQSRSEWIEMLEKVVKNNNRRASEALVEDQYEHISNQEYSTVDNTKEPAPTGKVTIVFVDVQNSTLLWDKAPEPMSIVRLTSRVMAENDLIDGLHRVWSGMRPFYVIYSKSSAATK